MKKSLSYLAAEKLGLPKDVIMNIPKITISGNRELYIENYGSIIEYTEEVMRIKTSEYVVRVEGAEMKISFINREDLQISGIFIQIVFEY